MIRFFKRSGAILVVIVMFFIGARVDASGPVFEIHARPAIIRVGETVQVELTRDGRMMTSGVRWSSLNTNILQQSTPTGAFRGLRAGNATVQAYLVFTDDYTDPTRPSNRTETKTISITVLDSRDRNPTIRLTKRLLENGITLLEWQTMNAVRVYMAASPPYGGVLGAQWSPVAQMNGNMGVSPLVATQFSARAVNARGQQATDSIAVDPPPAPEIVFFGASSDSADYFTPVELFWETRNTQRVQFEGPLVPRKSVDAIGSERVMASGNGAYTLYAYGAGKYANQSVTRTVRITVRPPPETVVTLDVDPRLIVGAGQKVKLQWCLRGVFAPEVTRPMPRIYRPPVRNGDCWSTTTNNVISGTTPFILEAWPIRAVENPNSSQKIIRRQTVTVLAAAPRLNIQPKNATVKLGETLTYTVSIVPPISISPSELSYASSDYSIAGIAGDSTFVGKKVGRATIKASLILPGGFLKDETSLTVEGPRMLPVIPDLTCYSDVGVGKRKSAGANALTGKPELQMFFNNQKVESVEEKFQLYVSDLQRERARVETRNFPCEKITTSSGVRFGVTVNVWGVRGQKNPEDWTKIGQPNNAGNYANTPSWNNLVDALKREGQGLKALTKYGPWVLSAYDKDNRAIARIKIKFIGMTRPGDPEPTLANIPVTRTPLPQPSPAGSAPTDPKNTVGVRVPRSKLEEMRQRINSAQSSMGRVAPKQKGANAPTQQSQSQQSGQWFMVEQSSFARELPCAVAISRSTCARQWQNLVGSVLFESNDPTDRIIGYIPGGRGAVVSRLPDGRVVALVNDLNAATLDFVAQKIVELEAL